MSIGKVLALTILIVVLYLAALGRLPAVWYAITKGDPYAALKQLHPKGGKTS